MAAIVEPARPHVRRMSHEDLDAVALVEARAYTFGWKLGIFRDCLRAGHACWVLEYADELVGHGVISVAAGEAHVLNVCVAPEYQGCGYGRRIVQRLLDTVRWYGAASVFLEVRPSNEAAWHLYTDAGFHEIGRRPNYYPAAHGREDAIVMGLEVLAPAHS